MNFQQPGNESVSYEELTKISRAMRSSEFRDALSSYVDERTDPTHRDEENRYWEESARSGSIPVGNVVLKPTAAKCVLTKLRLNNGSYQSVYINFSFNEGMQALEMGSDGKTASIPQVFSEMHIDIEDNVFSSNKGTSNARERGKEKGRGDEKEKEIENAKTKTCQTVTSCVSLETFVMCMQNPELLEFLIENTLQVIKKKFLAEGERLNEDYEILGDMTCKGVAPRYCLCPESLMKKNYRTLKLRTVFFFDGKERKGGEGDTLVTPQELERKQRKALKATRIIAHETPKVERSGDMAESVDRGEERKREEEKKEEEKQGAVGIRVLESWDSREENKMQLKILIDNLFIKNLDEIDCELDETEPSISVTIKNSHQKITQKLPYPIKKSSSQAKFFKDTHQLQILVPVVRSSQQ